MLFRDTNICGKTTNKCMEMVSTEFKVGVSYSWGGVERRWLAQIGEGYRWNFKYVLNVSDLNLSDFVEPHGINFIPLFSSLVNVKHCKTKKLEKMYQRILFWLM